MNAIGTGRGRSEVRGDAVRGADVHIGWLRKVVNGLKVWPAVDKEGNRTIRYPSGDEMLQAGEKLFKYGLGTKVEAEGDDGVAAAAPDLSGLSAVEKEQLLALAEKAEGSSGR